MNNKILMLVVALLASSHLVTHAADNNRVPSSIAKVPVSTAAPLNAQALKTKLSSALGLKISDIKPSPMPGLAQVITEQGLFYSSYDGKFFIQGKLFGLDEGVTNITELSLAQVRVEGMEKFKNDMIVYPAKNEKHVITVFTDISCGYCRKMHEQMSEYNDKGITIRYLPYPRSGIADRLGNLTQGYKDIRSVWCNEDPNKALTNAKAGTGIPYRICDKPIAEEFNFGRQVGVNGTPAIMLANGFMLPGYRQPNELIKILDSF